MALMVVVAVTGIAVVNVVPAVALGAVPSVVQDGVNGLLVAPGAPLELAAALTRLLADPAERARLGAHGRATVVDHHAWTAVGAQVAGLYASLAGAATAGG